MAATVEQLRRDTDSGKTRDKVSGPDPAAVPLGADEEAAGTPLSAERIALDRAQTVDAPARSRETGGKWAYLAILAVVAAILVTAVLLMH